MSETQNAPGGWTWSHFKSVCADVGSWAWGTAQGAFNEKAALSQIIVDAIIGMIPLLGDATAVRDLIAVIVGMVNDEEKRNSTWQWVLFVVLLFALIPVFGGVVKGVGRIIVKFAEEALHMAAAARLAHMGEAAKRIIEFLNRVGYKNAEKWLLSFRFAAHRENILRHCMLLLDRFSHAITSFRVKAGQMLPASFKAQLSGMEKGLDHLKQLAANKIPDAIKELDARLREIQTYIRSGGETTSRLGLHEIATGERGVTRADESRLHEADPPLVRSARGGFPQNPASATNVDEWSHLYQPPSSGSGFPNLAGSSRVVDGEKVFPSIAAYSAAIENRALRMDDNISRIFGPEGFTRGTHVQTTYAGGGWWAIGAAPQSAREWRMNAAVLDEFNRGGFIVTGKMRYVPLSGPVKGAFGRVSEQSSRGIAGQHLPGGASQAVLQLPEESKKLLQLKSEEVQKDRIARSFIDVNTGIEFTIQPLKWADLNGVWGYVEPAQSLKVTLSRLGAREIEAKTSETEHAAVTP